MQAGSERRCLTPLLALLGAAMALHAGIARGADAARWPTRPIRMIVPFPPASAADTVGRAVGQRLADALGQPVVADNRAGAGGVIAAELAARAAPDGYTLLIGSVGTHGINPALYAKLGYDAERDFVAVSQVATMPNILVVRPGLPAESVPQLIAHARAAPRKLSYGSSGIGTSQHFAGELLNRAAGLDMVHVPYKGSGASLVDLVGGQIDLMFSTLLSALPQVRAGRLRALAVSSAKRSALLPDLPTVQEGGVANFDVSSWFGLFVPAGTPAPLVARYATELERMLAGPELRQRLAGEGADPYYARPAEFAAFVSAEIRKWREVARSAGIRPQ